MITITPQLLLQIAPFKSPAEHSVSDKNAELYAPHLEQFRGEMHTPFQVAAFLANLLHESCCFKYVKEIASGKAYEMRKDLGNDKPGDGQLYKGRGLIQVTGKKNYRDCSIALFGDPFTLISNPELLETPENAVRSAYWFWNSRDLNDVANTGNFLKVVKIINGGTNGLAERQAFYNAALQVLMPT